MSGVKSRLWREAGRQNTKHTAGLYLKQEELYTKETKIVPKKITKKNPKIQNQTISQKNAKSANESQILSTKCRCFLFYTSSICLDLIYVVAISTILRIASIYCFYSQMQFSNRGQNHSAIEDKFFYVAFHPKSLPMMYSINFVANLIINRPEPRIIFNIFHPSSSHFFPHC